MGPGSATSAKADPVQEHRAGQYRQLLERAIALRPESLLVVGSQGGQLLRSCRQFAVPAAAMETDPQLVEELLRQGLSAMCWDRHAMPTGDQGYDWVMVHASELDAASTDDGLREALRVARSGLLLGQPWFDLSLPDQGVAALAEHWLQGQRQRRGELTSAILSIDRVMRALSEVRRSQVEGQYLLRWQARASAELLAEAEPLVADLAADSDERSKLAELLTAADTTGLSWSGMLVTLVRKAKPASTVVAPGW